MNEHLDSINCRRFLSYAIAMTCVWVGAGVSNGALQSTREIRSCWDNDKNNHKLNSITGQKFENEKNQFFWHFNAEFWIKNEQNCCLIKMLESKLDSMKLGAPNGEFTRSVYWRQRIFCFSFIYFSKTHAHSTVTLTGSEHSHSQSTIWFPIRNSNDTSNDGKPFDVVDLFERPPK